MADKDGFIEMFEAYINTLVTKQAELVIEINSLQQALNLHNSDSAKYYLEYTYDEETGIYSYVKKGKKRIGF